ncbi:hypothetical protein [Sediminibacterium sp.]|uniref:hypothetical protein n=1 Tax=Sediminibacterium sp. TaxID=1917865 RepID=UPI003F6F418A
MKISFSVSIIFILVIIACKNPKSSYNVSANNSTVGDTAKYYNIARFIEDEMKYVDLRNFTIIERKFNGLDTVNRIISKDEFLTAASMILAQAKWFMENKELFNETVFQDLGTESFTINYSSKTAAIKSIDLLLNEQTNLPKRLFIRLSKQIGDTAVTEQFSWTSNKQFMFGRSVKVSNQFYKNSSSSISWKNQDQ